MNYYIQFGRTDEHVSTSSEPEESLADIKLEDYELDKQLNDFLGPNNQDQEDPSIPSKAAPDKPKHKRKSPKSKSKTKPISTESKSKGKNETEVDVSSASKAMSQNEEGTLKMSAEIAEETNQSETKSITEEETKKPLVDNEKEVEKSSMKDEGQSMD